MLEKSQNKKNLFYPSVIITLCALFLFYKYILQVYPSIMTTELMQEFQISGEGLGNLAATFFYTYMITQLFVGVLIDKFGTRLLGSIAILLSALGVYFFSQSHTLLIAELSRALIGVGVAFATVIYLKMTAVWFPPRYFAFIGGLLATAAMLGAVFGEAPLSLVVNNLGWRNSLFLCALIGFALAGTFALVVKSYPKNYMQQKRIEHKTPINWRDILSLLRSKPNWVLTLYSGLAFSPLAVFGGLWGNPFLQEAYHLTSTQAASLASLTFIGLAIGGPVLGAIAERIDNKKQMMSYNALITLVSITFAIYAPLSLWLLGVCLFIFGFSTGAFMLGFAIGKEINKPALAATVIALINTGDAIFGAVSEPLIGKFLDLGWDGTIVKNAHHFSVHNYHLAFLTLPIYLLIAWVLSLLI